MDAHEPPSSQTQSDRHPQWHRVRLWQIQAVRDVLLVVAVVAVVSLGATLSVVTVPLLVGLGLAYLVEPLIGYVSQRFSWATRPRLIAVLVAFMLLGGALVSMLTIPRLVGQTNELVRNRALYAERFESLIEQDWFPESMREHLGPGLRWFASGVVVADYDPGMFADGEDTAEDRDGRTDLQPAAEQEELIRRLVREEMEVLGLSQVLASSGAERPVGSGIGGHLQRVAATTLFIFGGIINAFMFIFLTIFFFVFMSLSFPKIAEHFWSLTPVAKRERLRYLAGRMDAAVSGFVRGRLLICGFMAVAYGLGWSLFGVPHALVLATVTGILGLIPFAAMFMLPVAWILLAIAVGSTADGASYWYHSGEGSIRWWAILLLPGLVFAVVQIMDDYVLTPIIQGKATNLDVVSIVVAVIAGGALAGLYGMLLAIPVAACLRILWVEVALPIIRDWSEGRRVDPLPVENQKD